MLFNNNNSESIGLINNPVIKSVFIQQFEEGGFPIPPSSSFIVTDPTGSDFIIDENGSRLITEN